MLPRRCISLCLGKPRRVFSTADGTVINEKTSDISRFCDSYRIQTYNLLIRSQMLYSVELRSLKKILKMRLF